MTPPRLFPAGGRWIEPALALGVGAALIWAMVHLAIHGYLPQPYFYEPQDVWMDWFNTAYWAHQPGAYDSWGTIYPPLSFVVLRFLTDGACYAGAEGYPARDCDWFGMVTLHAFYVLNIVLTARTFLKIDRGTALPRSFALTAGLPMTYGLERGNLILLCFTCILLAYGPLVRSARLRWLAAGLAVNFKVYLIGTIFAQLLRRRWRWFEGALLATGAVYLVSYAILGVGTPREIYDNIASFSGLYQAVSLLDLWYAGTYTPVLSLLGGTTFPTIAIIGSAQTEFWSALLPVLIHVTQAMILLAAAAAWLRPEAVPVHRLIFLSIAIALITAESGGYTQILLILFVFMEPWRGFGRKWAIIAAYILCIASDIPIDRVPPVARESYLAGHQVIAMYTVGVGPFLRPGLILSLPFALACVTLRDVWADIRVQGWKNRWRFRSDLPLLIGDGAVRPPPTKPDRQA